MCASRSESEGRKTRSARWLALLRLFDVMSDICQSAVMRTTLNLDDTLYRKAKIKAAQEGRTVSELIEDGLRFALNTNPRLASSRRRMPLPVIEGGHRALPGQEMTPGKTARILLAQETAWARETS
jgi:plasmid stability protein